MRTADAPDAARPYVRAVAAAGLVALAALGGAWTLDLLLAPPPLWAWALALLLGGGSWAILRDVRILPWRGQRVAVAPDEILVYVALVALPPALVLAFALPSMVAFQVLTRRGIERGGFNVANLVISTSVAILVTGGLAAVGVPPLLGAVVGLVAYTATTHLLVSGVFAFRERASILRVYRERFLLRLVPNVAFGSALGLTLVALSRVHPLAVAAVLPLGVMAWQHGQSRAHAERVASTHRRLGEATRGLASEASADVVAGRILEAAGAILHAGRAEVRIARDGDHAAGAWTRDFEGGPRAGAPPIEEPIVGADGRAIGAVIVHPPASTRERYDDADREALRIIASAASAAFQSARAVADVHAARHRLETFLATASDAVIVVRPDGVLSYANRAALDRLGLPGGHLSRVRVHDVFDDASFLKAATDASGWLGEVTTRPLRGGAPYRAEVAATPLIENERVVGLLAVARDTTERRRAEAERTARLAQERRFRELREVDDMKTGILNMVAHDLGAPLSAIGVQLHLIRRHAEDLAEQDRRALEIADRNFQRVRVLAQDLLEAARLQAKRLSLHLAPTDVSGLARQAAESFANLASDSGVLLDCDAAEPLLVKADAGRIAQVIDNLLSNAIKFTPAGGRVRVETRLGVGAVHVRVSDTGAGLAPDAMSRLFQPFTQVHDTAARRGGTGLGLYLSRGIAELHGGTLLAESEGPGRGSTFTLALPVQLVGAGAVAPAENAEPAGTS